MSQANVDRVRAAFEHFERTGTPDLEAVSEDVEVHDHDLIDASEYKGLKGYLRWIENWAGVFSDFSLEAQEFIDMDDRVVVFFLMRALGARRLDYYNNRADALKAVTPD